MVQNHTLYSVCTDTHSVHVCLTMQYKLILHLRLDVAQELARRRVEFLLRCHCLRACVGPSNNCDE